MVLTDDVTGDEGEDLRPGDMVSVVDVHPDGGGLRGGVLNPRRRHVRNRHTIAVAGAGRNQQGITHARPVGITA